MTQENKQNLGPEDDSRFLRELIACLATHEPKVRAGTSRAAVAAIFRLRGLKKHEESSNSKSESFLDGLKFDALELLFIRRETSLRDKWSGQVAFPGGKAEKGELDQQAAEREAFEEVGLDLTDTSSFLYLGRLSDYLYRAGKSKTRKAVLATFAYLQICAETPPIVLSPGEIAGYMWFPIRQLLAAPRAPPIDSDEDDASPIWLHYICLDLRKYFPMLTRLPDSFIRWASLDGVLYPGILLNNAEIHPEFSLAVKNRLEPPCEIVKMSREKPDGVLSKTTEVVGEEKSEVMSGQRPPSPNLRHRRGLTQDLPVHTPNREDDIQFTHLNDIPFSPDFILWGMTLRRVLDIFRVAGHPLDPVLTKKTVFGNRGKKMVAPVLIGGVEMLSSNLFWVWAAILPAVLVFVLYFVFWFKTKNTL